jgi:hypothetical protein
MELVKGSKLGGGVGLVERVEARGRYGARDSKPIRTSKRDPNEIHLSIRGHRERNRSVGCGSASVLAGGEL